ncbi:hypothetical protein [Streptomyces sp. NPDC053367]|uniref:hypothetical protein n=1 Tax=Streptomyces sp. NPDC053367 TaxID=3365700 RepID=UPI0037D60FA5
MAVAPDDAAERAAEGLAVVCAYVEEIRADLRGGSRDGDAPLERVLTAARTGEDITGPLDALHRALQSHGDPLGLHGYEGGTTTVRSVQAIGISANVPGETVYLCPDGRCVRYWWRTGDAPVPRCAITGDGLRRDRL